MSLYPPPSYAANIWLTGEAIMLAVPEAGTIVIPLDRIEPHKNEFGQVTASNRGLAVLLDILRQRMQTREPTIGMSAAPVKYDVEQALASDGKYNAWLEAMNGVKEMKAVAKAEAESMLAELGL